MDHRCRQAACAVVAAVVAAFCAPNLRGQNGDHRAYDAKEDPWLSLQATLSHVEGPAVDGWQLARHVEDGHQWMKAYTKSEPGWLSMRIDATVEGTALEVLSILREVDLMPLWNVFCDHGELLHLYSPREMWAAAGVRLPWPVPRQYLFVRASVRKDPTADGGVIAIAQSQTPGDIEPPPGTKLPEVLRRREHLAVGLAVARLRPVPLASSSDSQQQQHRHQHVGPPPPLTTGEVYVTFDLSRVPGLSASSLPPSWLVNLIIWICVPSIWKEYLAAIASISLPNSQHIRRIQHDATGLYKWIAKRTGQPFPSRPAPSASREPRALVTEVHGDPHRKENSTRWPLRWWRRWRKRTASSGLDLAR